MTNIQIIDGAQNCTYSLYAATNAEFALLFPRGSDVGFPDEILRRLVRRRALPVFNALWERPVDKRTARGIHRTLLYELDFKKKFCPTRREAEMDERVYTVVQREKLGLGPFRGGPI